MKTKHKNILFKTLLSLMSLTVILGYGHMIGKINATQQQLNQIISEQNRLNAMLMKQIPVPASGTYVDTREFKAPVPASFIQSDMVAKEISRKLKQEIRALAESMQTEGMDALPDNDPNELFFDEGRKEFMNCMSYVDSIYDRKTMTEKEIMELKQYTSKLTPKEREHVNAELIRMLNSGEIELEDPALFFAQGL